MKNIYSDFEQVFSAPCTCQSTLGAELCMPGPRSYKSILMVYTERRVRVSCSVYDMLHTDAKFYIIMCKLVKLAYSLCCEPIDPSNMGFHKSIHKSASVHTRFYVDRFFCIYLIY